MKRLLAMAVLAGTLGFGLAGCTDPIPAMQDPNQPMQVSMTGYLIQSKILVRVIDVGRVPGGGCKPHVEVYNKTDGDLSVDFKCSYVDDHGVSVDDHPPGWQGTRVPPREWEQLDIPPSMSPQAADFRLQLRPGSGWGAL